jgi:hypothetical protein
MMWGCDSITWVLRSIITATQTSLFGTPRMRLAPLRYDVAPI